MSDRPASVSAPVSESRVMTAPSSRRAFLPRNRRSVPAAPRPGGPAPLATAAPKRTGRVRRFVLPLVILAVVGYAAKFGYDYFVEGRFLVSTDDAYVGAHTAIIAAKAAGQLQSRRRWLTTRSSIRAICWR